MKITAAFPGFQPAHVFISNRGSIDNTVTGSTTLTGSG
jgi:hypothetical protein